jgi:F0F1-type ATP synthase, epsilon subunit (mitochondrial delta subunit)
MASPVKVGIVSAEHEVWTGEATMVVAKTVIGEIGLLAGHEPVLAILADEGEIRVTLPGGEKLTASASQGFLSFENDTVTIVAGKAELV